MTGVRVVVGRPDAIKVAEVTAQVSADVVKALGDGVIQRVRKRVNHPAADALSVQGINQNAAVISGPRGGPGIIRPLDKDGVLVFEWKGSTWFRKSVKGKGLGPLIEAEANNLAESDVVIPNKTYE